MLWRLFVALLVCQLLLTEHQLVSARIKGRHRGNIRPRVRQEEPPPAEEAPAETPAPEAPPSEAPADGATPVTEETTPGDRSAAEDTSPPGAEEVVTEAERSDEGSSSSDGDDRSSVEGEVDEPDYSDGGTRDVDEDDALERMLSVEEKEDIVDEAEYEKRQKDFTDGEGNVKGWEDEQERDTLVLWTATRARDDR